MSDPVNNAALWAKELTRLEARGPGDLENAWRRLEARYGVPWRSFWSLRYRRPRDVGSAVYLALKQAYEAEIDRQMRRLNHELEITRATAGPSHAAVVAVEALVRAQDGEG